MVDELSPLHEHRGVYEVRSVHVRVYGEADSSSIR